MPAAKKSASTTAAPKKKTAPKKAAPKKTAAKKAEPKKAPAKKPAAPKVNAPPAFKPKSVHLLTSAGEYTLRFDTEASFNEAMQIIESAPSESGGRRYVPQRTVVCAGKPYRFTLVLKYQVQDA